MVLCNVVMVLIIQIHNLLLVNKEQLLSHDLGHEQQNARYLTLITVPLIMTFCLSGCTPDRAKIWALKTMGGSSVLHSTS